MPTLEFWVLLGISILTTVALHMHNISIWRLERTVEKLQEKNDE